MLVDANILLYAVEEESPFHQRAADWMEATLNGSRRVGLPWQSLQAFLRIVTNPRALATPLAPPEAWDIIEGWLDAPAAWVPSPGRGHREILGRLVRDRDLLAQPGRSLTAGSAISPVATTGVRRRR